MIEIRRRNTGAVLYRSETATTLHEAVVEAAKAMANLGGADLSGAYLSVADLSGAYLSVADLSVANLSRACLSGAYLGGANLGGAYLGGANLGEAYLGGAYLGGADLGEAYLGEAYLGGAYLGGAYLGGANLSGADLEFTVLDPDAQCPPISDKELTAAGFGLDGDEVVGWRTARSQNCGSTVYEPGKEYAAPWFSVDTDTACHPGLYLAGKEWLAKNYPDAPIVRVRCKRCELVAAGEGEDRKYRTRRLLVEVEQ